MRSPDFLRKNVETNFCEYYTATGAPCQLLTNSEQVLEAARETFLPLKLPVSPIAFSMRFWVDDTNPSRPPWPKPYVRGFNHLVFAGFDEVSSMLANLRTRQIIGRFSPGMAEDLTYYKTVIFPMLLTIVSATIGVAELHCACVADHEHCLLLVGESGTGKSTLSLALCQEGFGFISDDRTFCSLEDRDVYVWGLPTRAKLRGEALHWFRELHAANPSDTHNQGADTWFDPETFNGVRRIQRARVTSAIFLEQTATRQFCFDPLSSTEALQRLTLDLMSELPDAAAKRSEVIARIAQSPCWRLRYGGPPRWVANQILKHLTMS